MAAIPMWCKSSMRKGQPARAALVSEGIEGLEQFPEEFRKAMFVGAVWHPSSLNELLHSFCNYLVLVSVIKVISNKPFSGMGKAKADMCHPCLLPLSPRTQRHLSCPTCSQRSSKALGSALRPVTAAVRGGCWPGQPSEQQLLGLNQVFVTFSSRRHFRLTEHLCFYLGAL